MKWNNFFQIKNWNRSTQTFWYHRFGPAHSFHKWGYELPPNQLILPKMKDFSSVYQWKVLRVKSVTPISALSWNVKWNGIIRKCELIPKELAHNLNSVLCQLILWKPKLKQMSEQLDHPCHPSSRWLQMTSGDSSRVSSRLNVSNLQNARKSQVIDFII